MDATPSIRDEFKAMGEGNATVLRKWKGYLEVFGLTIVPLRAGERRDEVTDARRPWADISDAEADRIARAAVQSLADSEPDDDQIEAMDTLKGTPQESMFVADAATLMRHIASVIQNEAYDARRAPTGLHQDSEAK